jgi:S1-C subfamily serine protease
VCPVKEVPFRLRPEDATFANVGFFVDSQGETLTSLLGLAGCADIAVRCADGREGPARVAAIDQPSGLALLKTDLRDTVPLQSAAQAPSVGDLVLLASARAADGSISTVLAPGLVSSLQASVRLQGFDWDGLIAASVHVRPGVASAPLLDMQGRLAGVLLAVGPEGQRDGATCLAIPSDELAAIVSRLREGKSRRLGWLGVAVSRESDRQEGVRVEAALEGSPAHTAGIQAGDVLLQVNEHTIDDPAVLVRHVVQAGPGRTVEIKLLRADQVKSVAVEVGSRPLLICGGLRRPGEDHVRIRWRGRMGAFPGFGGPASPPGVPPDVLEMNKRMRRRIQELEKRLRHYESRR